MYSRARSAAAFHQHRQSISLGCLAHPQLHGLLGRAAELFHGPSRGVPQQGDSEHGRRMAKVRTYGPVLAVNGPARRTVVRQSGVQSTVPPPGIRRLRSPSVVRRRCRCREAASPCGCVLVRHPTEQTIHVPQDSSAPDLLRSTSGNSYPHDSCPTGRQEVSQSAT